jgi:predicted permease
MFRSDVRLALRYLLRHPVFTIATTLTISLGIGANAAVFRVVHGVLFSPLPYRTPERLVHIWQSHPMLGPTQTTYPDYIAWRDRATAFEGLAAYTFEAMNRVTLVGEGEPEQVQGTMVSNNLFSLMGTTILQGRALTAEDEAKAEPVALISERLWKRRFAGDPSVIGRSIRIGNRAITVVGVVADTQAFPKWSDLWLPLSLLEPMLRESRRFRPLEVVGRLKEGIAIEQAQVEMTSIASDIGVAHPETNKDVGARIAGLRDKLTAPVRPSLLAVWMAAGLVLLISCVNVAHLFLIRTLSRRRELATRLIAGASTLQVLRVVLTENLLVVFGGALGGIGLSRLLLTVLRSIAGTLIPTLQAPQSDTSVLIYTPVAIGLVTMMVSLPSLLELRRADLSQAARQTDAQLLLQRRGSLGPHLMASEIAFGFVALASTLLLARSFIGLVTAPRGFDGHNVLAVNVVIVPKAGGWDEIAQTFETRLKPEITSLTGVESVAAVNAAPMGLERTQISRFTTRFSTPGSDHAPDSYPVAQIRWITEDYFRVLQVPLISGSFLQQSDRNKPKYLINDTLAKRFFPDHDPVGSRLIMNVTGPDPQPGEIVGVVADVRDLGLDLEVQPTIYEINTSPAFTMLVRTTDANQAALIAAIREIVHRADPEAPIAGVRTIEQAVIDSLSRYRFALSLMAGFTVLSGLLLVVGVYGVVSYVVSRNARGFGIRAALGAGSSDIMALVLRKGLVVSAMGLALGCGLTWFSSKLLRNVLYNVSAIDPATMAVTSGLIVMLCFLSMAVPARRAGSTDPAHILREE